MTNGKNPGSITMVPLIESAIGVRLTYEMALASERVECVMFGGGEQGDLVADLGVEWTPEGTGLMPAHAQVLLSSRAAGVPYPMEAVFMDFRNPDGLRIECELARTLGYVGKVAIHPSQVEVINDVFTPSPKSWNTSERSSPPSKKRRPRARPPSPSTGRWWTCGRQGGPGDPRSRRCRVASGQGNLMGEDWAN